MLACESDSVETVEALLRGGANTQLLDAREHDAAHYGVTTGNQRITYLLQNGAPPSNIYIIYIYIFKTFTSPGWKFTGAFEATG